MPTLEAKLNALTTNQTTIGDEMNTDIAMPGIAIIPRPVPEGATINEEGLELLSIEQVKDITQISVSGIYSRAKNEDDDFPHSIDIGTKGKGSKKMWLRLSVLEFIQRRMDAARTAPVVHRTDRNNKQPVNLTREKKQALERARRGLPADYSFSSEEEAV